MVDPETIKEIQKLTKQGISLSSIAKQFGISWLTVRKYAAGEENSERDKPKLSHNHGATSPRVIPISNPSEGLRREREVTEISGLRVEQAENLGKLNKVRGPQEHPALIEKKARVEISELNIREFEATKKLQALKDEERRKAKIEEETILRQIEEADRITQEEERMKQRHKWVEDWQSWGLTQIPYGVNLPVTLKFQLKDTIQRVLQNRDKGEDEWSIKELVKETVNTIIQPFLDTEKAKKKVQLIQRWALPEVENYIKAHGLEEYVNEESKGKIKEYVRNHFMKVLVGNESVIFSHQVTNLLETFFKPIREEIREAQEKERKEKEKERLEKQRQEEEKREAERKAYLERMKEEQEKERIEDLIQAGTSRFYTYLAINRKDLKTVSFEEQQRARKYLEKGLREEIEGNETNQEVVKITDEILNHFFFEE